MLYPKKWSWFWVKNPIKIAYVQDTVHIAVKMDDDDDIINLQEIFMALRLRGLPSLPKLTTFYS